MYPTNLKKIYELKLYKMSVKEIHYLQKKEKKWKCLRKFL